MLKRGIVGTIKKWIFILNLYRDEIDFDFSRVSVHGRYSDIFIFHFLATHLREKFCVQLN